MLLLSNCSLDLRIFLKERTSNNAVEMAQAVDRFRCAHRAIRSRKTPVKDDAAFKKDTNVTRKDVICHHCSKVDHIRPSCPELKFAKSKTSPPHVVYQE